MTGGIQSQERKSLICTSMKSKIQRIHANAEEIEKINELTRGCNREENNWILITNNVFFFAAAVITLEILTQM